MCSAEFTASVVDRIAEWDGVETAPRPDGTVELRVGGTVLGQLAETGVVDLAFSPEIRDQLLTEGRADRYYADPRSSWVSVRVRTAEDVRDVLWLLRLAYLCRIGEQTAENESLEERIDDLDIDDEFVRLGLSTSLDVLVRQPSETAEQPTQTA
jgi:hypothetical protein